MDRNTNDMLECFQGLTTKEEKALSEIYKIKSTKVDTCTPNERAFLDEIREKFMVHNGTIVSKNRMAEGEYVYLYQMDFKSNLKELVNDTKTKAD